jgi:hypothetical protein
MRKHWFTIFIWILVAIGLLFIMMDVAKYSGLEDGWVKVEEGK